MNLQQSSSLSIKYTLCIISMWVLWSSCEKTPKTPSNNQDSGAGRKALVLNEGSLGNGNASISLLNLDSQTIQNNVFYNANQKDIGDILQSAIQINDKLFLVVTNSNIIWVIDKNNQKEVAQISVSLPRYIYPIDDEWAYVSSYSTHKMHVLHLPTMQITNSIDFPYPHVEHVLVDGDRAYVCNWDTANPYLYVVQTSNHTITDSILLGGKAPHSILKDKHHKIWVFGGNKYFNTPSTISQITNGQLDNTLRFHPSMEVVKPYYYAQEDEFYFLKIDYFFTEPQGVYKMKATDTQIPQEAFITTGNFQYFYSVQIDETNGDIYVTDPKGFVQRGDIIKYNRAGTQLKVFEASIGPSGLLFLKD